MTTLDRALTIAREAHAGQVDKAGRPYIEHVLRVMDAVHGEDAKVVAALHDVLEDRPDLWSVPKLLAEGFDDTLLLDVSILTKPKGWPYPTYIASVAQHGSPRARIVKIADLRDNFDPARLALLPERERDRLARKYAAALAKLNAS